MKQSILISGTKAETAILIAV